MSEKKCPCWHSGGSRGGFRVAKEPLFVLNLALRNVHWDDKLNETPLWLRNEENCCYSSPKHVNLFENRLIRLVGLAVSLKNNWNGHGFAQKWVWHLKSCMHKSITEWQASKTATYPQKRQNSYPCTETKHRHCAVQLSATQEPAMPCHAMLAFLLWYPCSYIATTGLQTCMLGSRIVWPSVEDPDASAVVAASRWQSHSCSSQFVESPCIGRSKFSAHSIWMTSHPHF